jgi:hypothetical protein
MLNIVIIRPFKELSGYHPRIWNITKHGDMTMLKYDNKKKPNRWLGGGEIICNGVVVVDEYDSSYLSEAEVSRLPNISIKTEGVFGLSSKAYGLFRCDKQIVFQDGMKVLDNTHTAILELVPSNEGCIRNIVTCRCEQTFAWKATYYGYYKYFRDRVLSSGHGLYKSFEESYQRELEREKKRKEFLSTLKDGGHGCVNIEL